MSEHTTVNEELQREEMNLATREPEQYSAQVDGIPWSWTDEKGIKHITVWDEGVEVYYKLRKGKIVTPESVF